MKRSMYGLILMGALATSGVSAESTHLLCEGTYTSCGSDLNVHTGEFDSVCSTNAWGRQVLIDASEARVEVAGIDSDNWRVARNVLVTDDEVKGEIATHRKWTSRINPFSAISTFGKSVVSKENVYRFSIDRTTGRLVYNGNKATCRVLEKQQLF